VLRRAGVPCAGGSGLVRVAERISPHHPNTSDNGRGWFRTSDHLSRVKRRIPRGVRGARIPIAKRNSSPCGLATCGARIPQDYARLSGFRQRGRLSARSHCGLSELRPSSPPSGSVHDGLPSGLLCGRGCCRPDERCDHTGKSVDHKRLCLSARAGRARFDSTDLGDLPPRSSALWRRQDRVCVWSSVSLPQIHWNPHLARGLGKTTGVGVE
jgi:hypothetical protein